MTLYELRAWLESEGFRTAENHLRDRINAATWYAYRRSKLPARRCECNDDKEGAQICVYPSDLRSLTGRDDTISVEVELCGEAGGDWYKLRAYGFKLEELPAKLDDIERRLVCAWNALLPEPMR